MKIGIIGSSGGAVARELIIALGSKHGFYIVTDRKCGLETIAAKHCLTHQRIETANNHEFSLRAKHAFDLHGGVDLILLFFVRLIHRCLFDAYPTFNLHPSLLPEYRGLGALSRAYADGIKTVGTTLHLVDKETDGGPIIAQVFKNEVSNLDLSSIKRISFAQKVYLSLYLMDWPKLCEKLKCKQQFIKTRPAINPALPSTWSKKLYQEFLIKEELIKLT